MVLSDNKEEDMVFKGKNLIFEVSHTLVLCVSYAPYGVFQRTMSHIVFKMMCLDGFRGSNEKRISRRVQNTNR